MKPSTRNLEINIRILTQLKNRQRRKIQALDFGKREQSENHATQVEDDIRCTYKNQQFQDESVHTNNNLSIKRFNSNRQDAFEYSHSDDIHYNNRVPNQNENFKVHNKLSNESKRPDQIGKHLYNAQDHNDSSSAPSPHQMKQSRNKLLPLNYQLPPKVKNSCQAALRMNYNQSTSSQSSQSPHKSNEGGSQCLTKLKLSTFAQKQKIKYSEQKQPQFDYFPCHQQLPPLYSANDITQTQHCFSVMLRTSLYEEQQHNQAQQQSTTFTSQAEEYQEEKQDLLDSDDISINDGKESISSYHFQFKDQQNLEIAMTSSSLIKKGAQNLETIVFPIVDSNKMKIDTSKQLENLIKLRNQMKLKQRIISSSKNIK